MVALRAQLDALAELERRFNGPIPEPLRLAARLGSPERVEFLRAEGQAAFFRAMTLGQVAILRRRRADGSAYPALLEDLALYRRQWRRWRRRARTLAALMGSAAAAE